MTSASDLLGLQELDLRYDSRRAMIADIDLRLVETDELLTARAEKEAAAIRLADLEAAQRQLEAQLEDLEAKLGPLETKLYDGSVRNPKELTDLQKEMDQQRTRRRELDDQGLVNLDQLEGAQRALEAAGRRLVNVQQEWEASQEKLRGQRAVAEGESRELAEDRSNRVDGMDRSALGLYDALRRIKQGRAVARLERTSCQGCRISLPTQFVQRVKAQEALIQCPNCERILVA